MGSDVIRALSPGMAQKQRAPFGPVRSVVQVHLPGPLDCEPGVGPGPVSKTVRWHDAIGVRLLRSPRLEDDSAAARSLTANECVPEEGMAFDSPVFRRSREVKRDAGTSGWP